MQKDSRFFEDIAKLATGAAGSLLELKREMENIAAQKLDALADRMQLVGRDEFEAMRDLCLKLREENEELKKRLDALEEKTVFLSKNRP